ncbi:MAG: hypothetical protein JOZ10_14580 [Acidobacteria bacterium]|nr:hypothetical protein [Acidobacteriota bacterium]MBV9438037.1 hypothetical protein [Acidobacteriota bacterium]
MIRYRIKGFQGDIRLSDQGSENVMVMRVNFVLTVNGREEKITAHAKLLMASDSRERKIEVYPPELPAGCNINSDELQDAIQRYVFGFLNTDEALKDFRKEGVFS